MRKIKFILSLLVCIFVISACGSKEVAVDEDYNGKTKQELQTSSENLLDTIVGFSDEELTSYLSSEDEMTVGLIESWQKIKDKVGKKVGFEKFEVTKSGNSVITVLTEKFEKRDVTLTIVYDSTMTVTSINTDVIFSSNEVMGKAVSNVVMCLVVVFTVLIIISVIIKGIGFVPKLQSSFDDNRDLEDEIVEQPVLITPMIDNLVDDEELVAVITAAIAASTGSSTDGFVVRTIKRRNSKWQKA